jgi:hypothetical protein
VKERLEKASQFIILWRTVNTLEYTNSINKLLPLLSAAGYFDSVIEGGLKEKSRSTRIPAIRFLDHEKRRKALLRNIGLPLGLVKRESHDGDISTVLGDMMSQLRLG